ncbi:hypothetical protein [Kribbella sp. CA-247076]|uniref:hypothetical protein n=1 Tax=Kribbella sp. CA-247076 TaxID=3239941 RepID=UPI003D90D19A
MNRRWSALALSVVAMGAVAATATEASADPKDPWVGVSTDWPDEGTGYPGAVPTAGSTSWPDEGAGYPGAGTRENYDRRYGVTPVQPVLPVAAGATAPSDTDPTAVLQAGASALGGAGVAFGAMWLFRRHHRLAG